MANPFDPILSLGVPQLKKMLAQKVKELSERDSRRVLSYT
jgi:hypothetical protein